MVGTADPASAVAVTALSAILLPVVLVGLGLVVLLIGHGAGAA